MLGKIFSKQKTSVRAAALILGVATLASRFVGIIRDRLLSGTFGAGPDLDAYYAAFRTPDFIYNLFVLGAITAGFIPIFTATLAKEGIEAEDGIGARGNELASALMTVLGVGLTVLAAVGILVAPYAVALLTPGFSGAQRALATSLTRIMFVSPVFLGLSSVLGGILQTKRRFFVYALAPVMYNVGIITGTLLLAPTMGIRGPAVGVAIGAFAHLLTQAIACGAVGFKFRFRWKPKDEGVAAIARQTMPRVASLAVAQVNTFILVGVASTIGAGSIAVFTLATNLQNFPVGILGVSFAVAAFPLISELAAKGKHEELVAQFTRTVRTVLFLVVPATVLMLLLRAQIVRVILGSGRFDWNDTIDTANTLAWLTMSLFAQALYPLVVRVFFALKDVKTPLYVSIVTVVIERLLAWVLVAKGYGTPGLAAAFSIASIFDVTVLWVMLKHRTGSLGEKEVIKALFQMSIAGAAMAVLIQFVKAMLAAVVNMQTFVGILTQGAVAGVLGLAAYLAVAYALGLREAREVRKIYRRRAQPTPASNIVQDKGEINVE